MARAQEVVIFRATRVVHIYNVLEHGRRYYRQCVYSTDWRWTLHDMAPVMKHSVPWSVAYRFSAGEKVRRAPHVSAHDAAARCRRRATWSPQILWSSCAT
jgi:hypothetical protein